MAVVNPPDGCQWKDIDGYAGLYMVSDTGRVWSVRRCRLLANSMSKSSRYYNVCLSKDGRDYKPNVHRLVAIHFIPNPNPDKFDQVNHKDEVKSNNCADNLEWCDQKYNMNYGNGPKQRSEKVKGEANPVARAVVQMDLEGNIIRSFCTATEASRILGIDNVCIYLACRGKIKTSGGFKWKYKEGKPE